MIVHLRDACRAAILLSTVLASSGLGACANTDQWQPPRTAQQPQLELADYRYEVEFAPGTVVLATGAQESLRLFLARVGVLPGDRVYVIAAVPATAAPQAAVPPSAPPGTTTGLGDLRLSEQRRGAVVTLLARNGIPVEPRGADLEVGSSSDSEVVVLVRRRVVSLPACPDWTQRPNRDFDNQPISNWSCSTAVNFGLMLADPDDLIRGRDPGYADGAYLARSIESYREGRTRDLIRDVASGELFPTAETPGSSSENAR
jgi:type IV pilus biogenesis protein CpaD/CtpE